jgi:hypothetical protein
MNDVIHSIRGEYERYKSLADGALAQVPDDLLSAPGPNGSSSLAVICWHVAGNLRSRFTDFLTTDGEKPWRRREEEFDDRVVTRAELTATWESGWSALFGALDGLGDEHLGATITIRGQELKIVDALHRSLAHTAYHVGQIVYLAKAFRGAEWTSLSIPRGQSSSYVPRTPRG